jgi:DNA repair protein RadC
MDSVNPTAFRNHNVTFVREVALQYRKPRRTPGIDAVVTPAKAADFMRRILPDNVREHFLALFLDGCNQVVSYLVAATGSANSCPVAAREIFQAAVVTGAVAVVVGHNHPSGQTIPSAEDESVTQRLRDSSA